MIGAEALPAIAYTLVVFFVPESPRWLLFNNKDRQSVISTLSIIDPSIPVDQQINHIMEDQAKANNTESIFDSRYRFPLTLAFLIAMFNQFSGINAFLYYAPRIFEIAGLEKSASLMSSVGLGVTNLIFTLLGIFLIDKMGRKQLMYIGSVGYIISLTTVAMALYLGWQGIVVPIFLFLFIASHAIGQGAIIWVFIAEIFPNHLRASGQAFGSSVHWVLAALIPALVPYLFSTVGASTVFAIFALMMVGQLIFVWKVMPETKGISLEDMSGHLASSR
jgi:MFS family permease